MTLTKEELRQIIEALEAAIADTVLKGRSGANVYFLKSDMEDLIKILKEKANDNS